MLKFSIVTPAWNAEEHIGDCLGSVCAQTCTPPSLFRAEHIVIDGASTDGTLAMIDRHGKDRRDSAGSPVAGNRVDLERRVISEPDEGIYDAMNKGIGLATGDVVGILNADDLYARADVLGLVAQAMADETVDACYGDLEFFRALPGPPHGADEATSRAARRHIVRRWRSGRFGPGKMRWGWMPPHPTFFVRKRVYEQHGTYRQDMGTAADYELMLRFLVKCRVRTQYIPHVLVHMRCGGVSTRSLSNRIRANRMDRKAWRVNDLKPLPWTLWLKPIRKLPQFFVSCFSR